MNTHLKFLKYIEEDTEAEEEAEAAKGMNSATN